MVIHKSEDYKTIAVKYYLEQKILTILKLVKYLNDLLALKQANLRDLFY